jgi:hypothetical protein
MGKLIFRYTDELQEDCREASKIELKVPDDMDIHEFKVMCVRMASALGYQQTSIENSFGNLVWGSEDKDELKELLDGLGIKKTNK